MGPEMMNEFRAQAERFGTRFITDDADRVELSDGGIQRVFLGDEEYAAKALILAMGAEPRRLGIPGELELSGRGVSTCGVCDGAFFKGEDVVVIGGGDSAMEDSIFISKYADELTIVHRRDEFRASKIMLERAEEQPNISLKTPFVPEEFVAGDDGKLASVRLRNAETGERGASRSAAPSSRSATSRAPSWSTGQVDTDEDGYVAHRGQVDADQARRRLRRRRPRRPHLPPGGHRGRHRLHGRARRRVVPARHAAFARGALAAGRRAGRGRADAVGRQRSSPHGARAPACSKLRREAAGAWDAAIASLAAAQRGVVARRQLLELGLSVFAIDQRVRSGRLHALHRGVYLVGHAVAPGGAREIAAALACGATGHVSAPRRRRPLGTGSLIARDHSRRRDRHRRSAPFAPRDPRAPRRSDRCRRPASRRHSRDLACADDPRHGGCGRSPHRVRLGACPPPQPHNPQRASRTSFHPPGLPAASAPPRFRSRPHRVRSRIAASRPHQDGASARAECNITLRSLCRRLPLAVAAPRRRSGRVRVSFRSRARSSRIGPRAELQARA